MAEAVIKAGCENVGLLDLNPRCSNPAIWSIKMAAEDACSYFGKQFDLVICRQAIGYLDLEATAHSVFRILRPGGRFVFNNFLAPRWFLKPYRFNGRFYLEAAGYFGDRVVHLQASPFIGADVTAFHWHKHDDIMDIMKSRFSNVHTLLRGRSAYYYCSV